MIAAIRRIIIMIIILRTYGYAPFFSVQRSSERVVIRDVVRGYPLPPSAGLRLAASNRLARSWPLAAK